MRAELVTDDAADLRSQLQAVTGERIAALDGIGEMSREAAGKGVETAGTESAKETGSASSASNDHERNVPERAKSAVMDLGL